MQAPFVPQVPTNVVIYTHGGAALLLAIGLGAETSGGIIPPVSAAGNIGISFWPGISPGSGISLWPYLTYWAGI